MSNTDKERQSKARTGGVGVVASARSPFEEAGIVPQEWGGPTPGILFFGAWREAGHHLRLPGGRRLPLEMRDALPEPLQPFRLDSQLAPRDSQQREGLACVHHVEGWTVVAWWDRSVDSRYGSNSAILVRGTHDFAAVVAAAREHFPELASRFVGLVELVEVAS